MMPCYLEEADERLLLHTLDISKIKTVDKDVVIVRLQLFKKFFLLKSYGSSLEKKNPLNLFQFMRWTFFHVLSGCDNTSSISGKWKISFGDIWKEYQK